MRRTAILLLLAACGDTATTNYSVDTLPGGAIRVVNHRPSGWTDTAGIALVLEHTIAPVDSTGGELAFPMEVRSLADGRIVVNDGGGAGILVFRADGTFERVLGRHGDGPGEYGQIFSMATHGNDVFVQECNKARLTRFHLEGDSTSQWATDDCMAGEGIVVDEDGATWLDGRLREPTRRVLIRWTSGERTDTFLLPAPQEAALWMAGNAAIPIPYSPHSVTAGAPPTIWAGHGGVLAFHRVDARNDTVLIATIPGAAEAVPDSIRQAAIDRFARSQRFAALVKLDDVPTTHAMFSGLDVDKRGRLWIHRPGPDGQPSHFEVLDSSGVWQGTVRVPAGPGRSPHWANGRMYRIGETPAGAPAIEIYRLQERAP